MTRQVRILLAQIRKAEAVGDKVALINLHIRIRRELVA